MQNHRLLSSFDEIRPGEPIVAVYRHEKLVNCGLVDGIKFGIKSSAISIILQVPLHHKKKHKESLDFLKEPGFAIREISLTEFQHGWEICTYEPEGFDTPEISLERAKEMLGISYHNLRSYPGDDFVQQCASGITSLQYFTRNAVIPCHHETVLSLNFYLGLKYLRLKMDLQDWEKKILTKEIHRVAHHGLRIEGEHVVHFSQTRMQDFEGRIKLDSINDFIEEDVCKEVTHPQWIPEVQMLARNRAVYILTHRHEWGKYSFLKNNCEHFCYFCCEEIKKSTQVSQAAHTLIKKLIQTLPLLLPMGTGARIALTLTGLAADKIIRR